MIPVLFDKNATSFVGFGKGKLAEVMSCVVYEELNGEYYAEFDYPVNGTHFEELCEGGCIILACPSASGLLIGSIIADQIFDICKFSEPINGIVTFTAMHASRRLANRVIKSKNIRAGDFRSFVMYPASGDLLSVGDTRFRIDCDALPHSDSFTVSSIKSVLSMLIGSEESVVSTLGFEVAFYTTFHSTWAEIKVEPKLRRGSDKGAEIHFGYNLTDISRVKDDTETFNAYVPFWDQGSTPKFVSGYIVQPTTSITPVRPVPLDLTDYFDAEPTEAQMISVARSLLDTNMPWLGSDTITVDFLNEDKESVLYLTQKMVLGDIVHVFWEDGLVDTQMRVVAYKYDVIQERYSEITLGKLSKDYVAITDGYTTATTSREPQVVTENPLSRAVTLNAPTPSALNTAYTVYATDAKGYDFVAVYCGDLGTVFARDGYWTYAATAPTNANWYAEIGIIWNKATGLLTFSYVGKGSSRSWSGVKPTILFY